MVGEGRGMERVFGESRVLPIWHGSSSYNDHGIKYSRLWCTILIIHWISQNIRGSRARSDSGPLVLPDLTTKHGSLNHQLVLDGSWSRRRCPA